MLLFLVPFRSQIFEALIVLRVSDSGPSWASWFKNVSFRKALYKNSLLKCSRRVYYAPFAVLRYIFTFKKAILLLLFGMFLVVKTAVLLLYLWLRKAAFSLRLSVDPA